MSILFSHNSSLERLRSIPPQIDRSVVVDEALSLAELTSKSQTLSEHELRSSGLLQRPVHRLVPHRRHATRTEATRIHRSSLETIPPGLIRRVSQSVYSAGPELTFVQMATDMSLLGAVVLGHELCGTYSHFAQMISGFYERTPLTCTRQLADALDQMPGVRGVGAARTALRWIRDGSASPMETVVSCMLNLPNSMGGFGMVAPTLNHAVLLDPAEARVAGAGHLRIDTAYPDVMTGVEFDGAEYHHDYRHDRRRREVLAHKGWNIYVLNVDELTDYGRLKDKVELLDAVPRRRGETMPDERMARQLLKRLLAATRCGVGINAALFGAPVRRGQIQVHL